MEDISAYLSEEQIARLLELAIPALKTDYEKLTRLLKDQQWQLAAKQAHHLKSTVILLQCKSMVVKLDYIINEEKPVIISENFNSELEACYQQCLNNSDRIK